MFRYPLTILKDIFILINQKRNKYLYRIKAMSEQCSVNTQKITPLRFISHTTSAVGGGVAYHDHDQPQVLIIYKDLRSISELKSLPAFYPGYLLYYSFRCTIFTYNSFYLTF